MNSLLPLWEKTALALDIGDKEVFTRVLKQLHPKPHTIKIGLEVCCAFGMREAITLTKTYAPESRLFLDLKLHDIPNTVAKSIHALAKEYKGDIAFLTVHVAGGKNMLRAALEEADGSFNLVGVTVLTSLQQSDLEELSFPSNSIGSICLAWAHIASEAGLTWLVASSSELSYLLSSLPHIRVVTPGIRPANTPQYDQNRIAGPREALLQGSSLLVVGRPIYLADNPQRQWQEYLTSATILL